MLKAATSLFLILFFSPLFASANLKLTPDAYDSDIYFKVDIATSDLNSGKNLIALFSDLNNGRLNQNTVKSVLALKDKKNPFDILAPFYARLEKAYKIESFEDLKNNCALSSEVPNEFTTSLIHRFDLALDRFCRSIFIQQYTGQKKFSGFSEEERNYFLKIVPFYLEGNDNEGELIKFLKNIKKNTTEHAKISEDIIEVAVKFDSAPSKNLLQNLKLNEKVQTLVQNKSKNSKSAQSYYVDEFVKLYKDAVNAIQNDEFSNGKQFMLSALEFYAKNKTFIPQKRVWTAMVLTAKEFFYKGKDDEALELLAQSKNYAPESEYSESHFHLIWPHVVNKDFTKLKAHANKFKMYDNFDRMDSKVQYWLATALVKTGEEKKGNHLLSKILTKSPFSFYSIVALKDYARDNKQKNEAELLDRLIAKEAPLKVNFSNLSSSAIDSIKRMNVWYKLNFDRFGALETRYLLSLTHETGIDTKTLKPTFQEFREYLIVNLIKFLNDQEKFISSFKLFQDNVDSATLTMNYRLVRLIFPTNYIDLIKKNAGELDPLIIISLMRQESAFNPHATSSVGAKGLMQLMPATAKRLNKKVKLKNLVDPNTNIALGTKYLKLLVDRFEGNLIFTLASYNAGENRIDRWRKEIFRNNDPLSVIESIPYEETRNYVKLIYRNNFFYNILLHKTNVKVPLEETFKVSTSK